MATAPILLMHPSSLEHQTGPHPERAERIVAIEAELSACGWAGYERVSSPAVPEAALTAVHAGSHVERIRALAAAGGGAVDADTVMSAGSFLAASHAAGGAVELVSRVVSGAAPVGFSVHRPPGHHATADRAMGFCLFNSVAVAARWALDELGLERVMIVDYDVHHGNGTNDLFAAEPRLLFVSVHQSPLYPGTGPATDVGHGAGEGFNVNLPVDPGSGDAVFVGMVEAIAVPLALAFEPQLLLISAGFDAHRDDPLAECVVTPDGFAAMTALLRDAGAALGVPVAGVLEGGYGLDGLARSLRASMEALAAPASSAAAAGRSSGAVGEWPPVVRGARARVARRWPALAD
ncbi:MAG TPA: histone deacetylase [Solirubrobacteraceae bacterium]|nr:histone deacetylase [Solirubrobacteraceae bacterium]